MKCIIFVERRTAARVLANLVNHLECLSEFLQARSICGANAGVDTTRVQQQSTVAEFNQGQVDRDCLTAGCVKETSKSLPSLKFAYVMCAP